MLPPEVGVAGTGGSAAVGPACACTLKPLPCLVDNWVTVRSVPYEQPLSIQTDMEYTLDTRLFPGWDPVMGDGQAALVVDTAVLTARTQQAAAAATPTSTATGSRGVPLRRLPSRATRYAARQQQQQQQQQAAAPSRNVAAYSHPAPADLPPSMPRYHPAFRPAAAAPLPHYQQQAPAAQPTTNTTNDADLLALIASIDVDPAGYTLDVDWLLAGQQQQQQQQQQHPMATHNPVQTNLAPPRPLPAAQIQHQVAPPAMHHQHQQPQPRMRTYASGITDYQSQFYPGASWGAMAAMSGSCRNNACVGGSSCSASMACNNMTGSGAVMSGYLQAQRVVQSRPMKRKLPVDSPCEGSLPVAYIDLTGTSPTPIQTPKRGRWAGDWGRAFGLGMPHAPSPLHNRAY